MEEKQLPLQNLSNYILYAKGHYEKFTIDGSVWGDLKRIQSKYCMIDEEHVRKQDIILTLLYGVEDLTKGRDLMVDFISSIDPRSAWKTWPEPEYYEPANYDFDTAVVGKCLSILRFLPVLDSYGKQILNIGEADPQILPLNLPPKVK